MRGAPRWLVLAVVLLSCGGGSSASEEASPAPSSPAVAEAAVASTASTSPPATVPVAERRAALLDAAWRQYGSPGAVAVVHEPGGTWRHAVGAADEAGTPADPAMTFRAASITKPVVAALALALAERGVVDLDEPVAPLLRPGVLRPDPPVTLRQLLAHTAGIFNEGSEGDPLADVGAIADPTLRSEGQAAIAAAMGDQGAVVPAEVTVAAAETHDRVNAPGGGYHYSNAGYQAAALYLEAETGRPLADLLRDVVTGPLGLERTTLAPADRTPPQLRGYETETVTGNRVDAAEDLRAFGNGANGGALTTADDLASFFRALVRGELVGPDLVQEMQLPTAVATRAGSAYGLGLASYELSCGRFYGHEGGVSGTASIAMVDGTGERAVVVALNQRGLGDPRLPQLADYLLCLS